ncbi:S8 family serine peptidase [Actinoplanes sp. NPDC049265]|uniref:S8 family serine peptidase n=1 Tax=Actinoplanes sp. NPDC049265 TaxID=3363902 RepID=UPI00371000BE
MGRKHYGLGLGALGVAAALVAPSAAMAAEPPLPVAVAKSIPAKVSKASPVRITRTTKDRSGRPTFTTRTATSRAEAERLIRASGTGTAEVDQPIRALDADTYQSLLWALPKIKATDAWPTSTGSGVTVAVLDTGVSASHPDLAGQVLTGYNAFTDTTGTSSDAHGHGTHVAGTIAALANNGQGVAGVAPNVKILPVKVLADNGGGTSVSASAGMVWAADHGAQVISMSLGGAGSSQAYQAAIDYARSRNVVVIAAAGNERTNGSPVMYPGAAPGVVAVAATDNNDSVAYFSNAGSYVDVAAPGVNIYSTVPGDGYAYKSGTSMATPHVAAVAALLLAKNPALTPDQVEQAMESSAKDLGTAGKDNDYGYGRVDAVAALAAVSSGGGTTPPPPPPAPAPAGASITSDATDEQVLFNTKVDTKFTVTIDGATAAKRTIQLCTADKGAAEKCKNGTTKADGTYTFTRKVTFPYTVRLSVPATRKSTVTGTSGTYTYTVRSEVSLAVRKNSLVVSLTGANKQVNVLQRSADGITWETDRTFKAATKSTLTKVAAGYQYQVVVPDTALVAGSTSNAVQM